MRVKSLVPWSWDKEKTPFNLGGGDIFETLQGEMNRMFDNFSRDLLDMSPLRGDRASRGNLVPRMDMTESDKEFQITAELPGVDEKDLEVRVSGDTLTIKGEKKSEKEDRSKDYYRMERAYGAFQRTIPLPSEVVSDKIEASFKRGVLTVRLPKNPQSQKDIRKIPVMCD
jgi:HSP20 family protein